MPFSFFGEVAGVFLWTSHGSLMLFLNVCFICYLLIQPLRVSAMVRGILGRGM